MKYLPFGAPVFGSVALSGNALVVSDFGGNDLGALGVSLIGVGGNS